MPPATTSRWISRCRSHASTYGTASAPKPTVRNCRSRSSPRSRREPTLPCLWRARAGADPIRVRMPRCVPRCPSSPPPRRSPGPRRRAARAAAGGRRARGAAGRTGGRARSTPGPSGRPAAPARPTPRGAGQEVRERRATVAALEVLRRWDGRRARAWARGEPRCCGRSTARRRGPGGATSRCSSSTPSAAGRSAGVRPQVVAAEALTRTPRPGGGAGGRALPRPAVHGRHAARSRGRCRARRLRPHVRVVTLVRSPTGWRVERVAAR